ncbi:hypothetical protein QL285_026520 [Trifolium repens]|nr:hypothetical protein QL285_026520 [Trifolium repens]
MYGSPYTSTPSNLANDLHSLCGSPIMRFKLRIVKQSNPLIRPTTTAVIFLFFIVQIYHLLDVFECHSLNHRPRSLESYCLIQKYQMNSPSPTLSTIQNICFAFSCTFLIKQTILISCKL